MGKKYSLDQLRQVKGIGSKTIERIIEQFDESEYISKYDSSIHIEPNSLVNGDMLEVMNGIPDESVDMILTDLPYGTTACSWDEIIPFDKLWKQYNRVIKDNGAIVLFGSEPFSTRLRMSNIDNYRYDWVWVKERPTNPLLVKKRPPKYTEYIHVFYKQQPKYNPQKIKRKHKNKRNNKPQGYIDRTKTNSNLYAERVLSGIGDDIYRPDYLEFSMERGKHPTQKPTKLLVHLIKTYTNEGDIVLDSTMGSGSTCVAAKNTGRKYIGIELDEKYFEIAKKRVNGGLF